MTQADLRKSAIRNTSLKDAACEKANLTGADLEWSSLRGANFRDANLSQASLAYCDLRGANLSGTKTRKTHFIDNEFDEQTRFPDGFEITDAFHWKGRGVDPRTAVSPPPVPTGPLDFDQFMQQLALTVDSSRLKKSLKMLKADSFELFSKVDEEGFVGVVKSQSDVDLVYSCRLTSDGEFSCCTQNLNPCGGLRGALCKHLLVLIIGLTKCRELDPTMASGWAQASLHKKPALDRDAMSETLLRYKGAEAGEIDWRPVETVPEDYYAF